jgi:hypothetical protein
MMAWSLSRYGDYSMNSGPEEAFMKYSGAGIIPDAKEQLGSKGPQRRSQITGP